MVAGHMGQYCFTLNSTLVRMGPRSRGTTWKHDVPDRQCFRLVSVDTIVVIEPADFLKDLAGGHVLEQDEAFLEHAEGAQALDSSEPSED